MMFLDCHVRHNRTFSNFELPSNNIFASNNWSEIEVEEENEEEQVLEKSNNDYIEKENDDIGEEILQCGKFINKMLNNIIEKQKKMCSNNLFGYEEIMLEAFRRLPKEKKLEKFNKIMNIIEN
ncbi:uncharacterized protein LOC122500007 [Leptopilina heterotoma]|uniref:uncharacterized protein LOC122500007 n=1 Tax=Leptopilina heterotoma TaxID=63436 RepID=UPI001CA8F803|nr:uncharacterized protein LOC122500007 [Leptopilina heterotoma]